MYRKPYENTLTSLGYHGSYFVVCSNALYATFWKGEYQISFSIRCMNDGLAYDDIKHDFMEIFKFTKTESARNLSKNDNIEELLLSYLVEQTSFENIYFKGKIMRNIHASKNDIRYSIGIHMYTTEDYSLDKFDEDHDSILELLRNDIVKILEKSRVQNFKTEITPDFLSVKVSICHNKKIHHIDIHSFYDNEYSTWYPCAARIACYYWDKLVHGGDFLGFLRTQGFSEVEYSKDNEGNIVIYAYFEGSKYRIMLNVENEVIPFDNLEGHAFEEFCANVLAKNGFEKIRVTQGSGDQGVDIIAYKDDAKYGIQCKRYSSAIGNKAVQEILGGKAYYQCHVGVVLTNQYFTKSAIELAERSGIVLWNRDKLLQMVEKYYTET